MMSPARELRAPMVLILDDDDDMREALGDTLAIIDVNLGPGQPSGLDAHAWLVRNEFAGQIVFLTGHAKSHTLVQEALRQGSAKVLQKPIGMSTLRELVRGAG